MLAFHVVWSSSGASDVWSYGGFGCCNFKWSASAWWFWDFSEKSQILILSALVGIYIYLIYKFNLITVQQDATYSVYYISVGSSTCFGCWHPSSGASTNVITTSGID